MSWEPLVNALVQIFVLFVIKSLLLVLSVKMNNIYKYFIFYSVDLNGTTYQMLSLPSFVLF